jgi:hypothetical protein
MRKGPLYLATLGLALNLVLWGVPGMVAASAAAHYALPDNTPTLSAALQGIEVGSGPTPSLLNGLVQLIGAEAEAMQVAGAALQQQPPPEDLVPRANAASARVLQAATSYVRAAQALTNR